MADNKSDIRLIQLANYIKPEIKEMTGRKWVLNGINNTFFQYVIDRYNGSPTNSAIIDGYADLMYGRGLADMDAPDKPLEDAILDILPKKEIKKIISDWALFTSSVIEVTKVKGKPVSIRHIPREMVAPSVIDDEESIVSHWYSWDWTRQWKYTPEEISAWEKDDKSDVSLMVISPYKAGKKYFSDPSYLSGLQYAEMEEEMSNYSITHIKGGMTFGYIVNFNNGATLTPAQRDQMEKKITDKLTGTPNAGRFIISFNNGKEAEVTITAFEQSDAHSQWDWLSKEAENKIIRAHRVTNPILVGIKENTGLGNNADEMDVAEHQLMKRVIAPKQEYLLDAFKDILEEAGIKKNLFFLPLTEIDEDGDSVDSEDEKIKKNTEKEEGKVEEKEEKPKEVNDDTKKKREVALSKVTNSLIELGEDVDNEEWDLVSSKPVDYDTCDELDALLLTAITPRENLSSKQDVGLYKVRYAYMPNRVSTNDKGKVSSRTFCQEMVAANKVYRKEDIVKADSLVLNPNWGEYGTERYDIFKFKGGGDCRHWWERRVYLRQKKNGKYVNKKPITESERISVNEARRQGLRPEVNDINVARPPYDMDKRGFLHKFSKQFKAVLAGFNPNQKRAKDGEWVGDKKLSNKEKDFIKDSKMKSKVYHITTEDFEEFDPNKGAQGVIWFTSDKSNILNNSTGAALRPNRTSYLIESYINIKKMAGWDEYDKYSFGELINMGYDGVKLGNDYVVFEGNQVLITNKTVKK